MSELDSLIDELFPANKNNGGQTISTSRPSCRRSEWDDESDGDQQTDEGPRAKMHASQGRHFSTAFSSSPAQPCTSVGVVAPTSRSGGHSFDDDSDADVDVGRVAAQQQQTEQQVVGVTNAGSSIGVLKPVLFPVPFPSLTSSEGSYACAPRCYLTNLGAPLPNGVAHPTLRQLRAIAENEQANAKPPHAQVMLQKGAFHAAVVELGNGSLDHHGDYTGDGGCPHILCRQCNYMVVRLQDAQWDVDGEVNLYLTLRNYYPDWCRLASSTPVGGESSAKTSRAVLSRSLRAAAYCCQCSWMTVKNARAVIETKLTDVALARPATESGHPFATEFPLPAGETRRPPLWVCYGHAR
ncbi:hypothetical protein JKF63_01867 [Porcisia hertigi]|uniref:Cilia- and flagella-associated protein 418 n=1 Tax=Porcisia hertigi TaxID=2761500 RepID=A0A836HLZ1_9TRYP|nr:hypothetical protein JKF63_01867 [Porcisia hertigi]